MAHLRRADHRRAAERPVFSAYGSGSENQPVLNLEKVPGVHPYSGAAALDDLRNQFSATERSLAD